MNSIDECFTPTHDEKSRQGYISSMRKYILKDVSAVMASNYEKNIKPNFIASNGREPDSAEEVKGSIENNLIYRTWSSLRYNAQEMVWESVREGVEREIPQMIATFKDSFKSSSHSGSLRLNKNLDMPDYVESLDVHLMPGCWQTEHALDDVSQGAVYFHGGQVFRGSLLPDKKRSGVAASVSKWLSIKYPNFSPDKILETGCTIGSNLLPYNEIFPNAELYGVDVAAPCLRYAHARAVSNGVGAHFSQQNAEDLDFPDSSFDLIVSSFFFHEISVEATKRVLSQCHRLLKPGGMMVHMELPSASQVDPYYNFVLDWDNEHNNEPHYRDFRSQNFQSLMNQASFHSDDCFTVAIPDIGGASPEYFRKVALGDEPPPKHGNYTSWYLFGAFKS